MCKKEKGNIFVFFKNAPIVAPTGLRQTAHTQTKIRGFRIFVELWKPPHTHMVWKKNGNAVAKRSLDIKGENNGHDNDYHKKACGYGNFHCPPPKMTTNFFRRSGKMRRRLDHALAFSFQLF